MSEYAALCKFSLILQADPQDVYFKKQSLINLWEVIFKKPLVETEFEREAAGTEIVLYLEGSCGCLPDGKAACDFGYICFCVVGRYFSLLFNTYLVWFRFCITYLSLKRASELFNSPLAAGRGLLLAIFGLGAKINTDCHITVKILWQD